MPENPKTPREEAPRTDQPRTDRPSDPEPARKGYFATEEEERIAREEEAESGPAPRRGDDQEDAGGDREI